MGMSFFMDAVDDAVSLREEVLLKLEGGGYPVARAVCNGGCIKIIEGKLVDVRRHILHYRAPRKRRRR